MSIFDRVKKLCDSKGISVSQLEKEIKISQGAAYKWKTSSPSQKMLKKLSDYFNVSTDYLIDGKEKIFVESNAEIHMELARQSERIKKYMLKFANLSEDKRNQIMSLIDMLEDK